MKILKKPMKKLALLSTAAILPILAITSCSDDDDPAAISGNEVVELTQEVIKNFFVEALDAQSSVGIMTGFQFTFEPPLSLEPDFEIINTMMFNGPNINLQSISLDQSRLRQHIAYSVIPEVTNLADNSGIILKIVIDDISPDADLVIKMEYLLHYKITQDERGLYQFELDLNQSYYSLNDRDLYRFGGANILEVPK